MWRWCCTGGRARAQKVSVASAIGLCVSAIIVASPSAEARELSWAIPAGPLQQALVTFAIEANVSISTPPRGFGAHRAPQVSGAMSAEDALGHLLDGSGFTFERVNAAAYRIVPGIPQAPHVVRPVSNEIVITARRRPETLDNVPAAATAITGDALQGLGARDALDVLQAVAGLSASNIGPGRNKIFIRGVSDGEFTGRASSTVGIYYDETRLIDAAPDPDLAPIDLDALEILRGPQGTLYGGGAIAGVYRMTPRAPDLQQFGGEVRARFESAPHGGLSNSFSAVLNAPIAPDRAALRFVGYREVEAGWLDNPGLDLKNTNETRRIGGRLTLLLDARNGWTVKGALVQQDLDSEDAQYISESQSDGRPTRFLEPHDNDFHLLSLTVRGPTSFGALTSTTSLVRHSFSSRFDATDALLALGAAASQTTAYDEQQSLRYFTQEVRLAGVASPFPWTVGAFASLGDLRGAATAMTDPGTLGEALIYASHRSDDVHRYGVFGDLSLPLTQAIALELGARYFRSELDVEASTQATNPAFADDFSDRRSRRGWVPSVQLSYRQSDAAYYYALVSQGNRPGGFNTGAASLLTAAADPQPHRRYDPDRIWNAELGAKYRLMNDRLRIRLAAFHQLWENVQTDQLVASGLSFTGNVGDATNDGVEIESSYVISPEWRVEGQVTYVHPVLDQVSPTFPSSDSLPGAPHLLAGAKLQWRRDIAWGTIEAELAGLYVGRADITFSQGALRDVGGYFDGDVHISLTHEDWRTGVYIDNIANSSSSTFSYGSPFTLGVSGIETPLHPRALGIELRRAF